MRSLALFLALMLVRDQRGRRQRRNTPEGSVRRPNLRRHYRHRLKDVRPGDFTFRVTLIRPGGKKGERHLTLDPFVEQIEWTDDGPILSGYLSLHRAEVGKPLPIRDRDRVRLFVRWNRRWFRLWELVVDGDPVPTLETATESVSLVDDLDALKRNERHWEFKKTRRHPRGWTADQIAREVCRREGVRPGRLAKGTVRIKKLKRTCSGLEIIKAAYARERKKTDRKFVIRFRGGRLDVLPLQRNRVLYEIRGLLRGATLSARRKSNRPVTMIEAKGTLRGRKVEVRVFRRRAIARFGLSSEERSYGRVDSKADLKEQAMRDLADELRVTRTADLEIPGVPFIERGDTVRWVTNEPGWSGPAKGTLNRQFAYVTAITHSATAGDFTSSVSLSQVDPYLADARRRARDAREEKNRRRNRNGS